MHASLELVNDSLGVLLRARLSAQVARPGSLGDGLQRGLVDPVRERVELHVPEHHHAREEERSRVGAAVEGRGFRSDENFGSGSVSYLALAAVSIWGGTVRTAGTHP